MNSSLSRILKLVGVLFLLVLVAVSFDATPAPEVRVASEPVDVSPSESVVEEAAAVQKAVEVVEATKPVVGSRVAYDVVKVVDGDTVDVSIDGTIERLRLIGINTPETVDPRKSVECFGVEASNKAKALLLGKKVILEADSTEGERDKYGRLLRYVFLEDGTNINLLMIKEGYAYEYTYATPYKYQAEFRAAQKSAEAGKAGLWGAVCDKQPVVESVAPVPVAGGSCSIKGNISSKGEKIYHVAGCGSYGATKIEESQGERWFCSEQEALDAGWRKALNCS